MAVSREQLRTRGRALEKSAGATWSNSEIGNFLAQRARMVRASVYGPSRLRRHIMQASMIA